MDFTATKLRCGIKSVGDQYAGKKQGQFCFLDVSAKNNGKQAVTLDGGNQKLLDDEGAEYSSDSEATLYEDSDSRVFLEQINPGNTAEGVVVFDIPKDVKPLKARLAGGLFGIKDVTTVDLR